MAASETITDSRITGKRWEAYDVAHLAGTHAVGVMVVAEQGEFKKSAYRKFKVNHRGDDLTNLREIIARRAAHQEWPRPDLIVVDGGGNQLLAARAALLTANLKIPLVAVVKNEHHRAKEVIADSGQILNPAIRRLAIRINAEAHRFALTYHRQQRRKIV